MIIDMSGNSSVGISNEYQGIGYIWTQTSGQNSSPTVSNSDSEFVGAGLANNNGMGFRLQKRRMLLWNFESLLRLFYV